jgi:hypothetical protein
MNDTQILMVVLAAAPIMLTVVMGILINNSRLGDTNARLGDINLRVSELRSHMDARFDVVDLRFDDMRDMWRSELHRVEEVLDARLRHLEDRG